MRTVASTASARGRNRGVDVPAPRRPFRDGERVDADGRPFRDGERVDADGDEQAASACGRANGGKRERGRVGERTASTHVVGDGRRRFHPASTDCLRVAAAVLFFNRENKSNEMV